MIQSSNGSRFARAAALSATLLIGTSSAASGATPLPAAFSGGFLPPSTNSAVGADKVRINISHFVSEFSQCYRRGTADLSKGIALPMAEAAFLACTAKARQRYDDSALYFDGQFNLDPCLDVVAQDALGDSVEALVLSSVTSIWCDPASASPFPPSFGTVGLVSTNKTIQRGESMVLGNLRAYSGALSRCYRRGVKRLLKGVPDDLSACTGRALTRYAGKAFQLTAQGLAPACIDQTARGTDWENFQLGLNSQVYCASPSGAFVDGAASF